MKNNALRAAAVVGTAVLASGLPAVTAQASAPESDKGAVTSHEEGHILSCLGQAGNRSVMVDLYKNSLYGSFAQVNVEGPDGEYGGGSNPARIFDNGSVSVDVPIRHVSAGGEGAGTATVRGAYAPTGESTQIHNVYREPTWVVVSRGIHQQLSSSLSISALGETTSLSCRPALEYDLTVTRTPM